MLICIYIYTHTFSVIYNILFIVSYVCVAIYNLYSSGILVLMGDTYSCLLLIFLFNGDIISTFICLMVRPSINPVWPLIQPFISIYIYITLTFETTKQLPVWSGYVLKKKTGIYIDKSPNYRSPFDILVTSPLFVCYPTVIGGWRQGLTTKTSQGEPSAIPWGSPIEIYHNEIRAHWWELSFWYNI